MTEMFIYLIVLLSYLTTYEIGFETAVQKRLNKVKWRKMIEIEI